MSSAGRFGEPQLHGWTPVVGDIYSFSFLFLFYGHPDSKTDPAQRAESVKTYPLCDTIHTGYFTCIFKNVGVCEIKSCVVKLVGK